MKKIRSILFFGLMLFFQNGLAQDVNHLRANYQKATVEKSVCQSLITDLSNRKISNLELAYLGALETIWAKYTFNPFSKLSTFKKGKKKIEQAVHQEPENIEIRYLRLTIQKNAPGFLGYNENIKADELFLKQNSNKVSSEVLRDMIKNVLKE